MPPTSRVAALLAGAVLALVGGLAGAPRLGPAPAAAATEQRAAVVVATGTQVVKVCVRFSEPSLTGAQVLQRAGVDPVFAGFSGIGAGVCALCGVGCEAGGDCLTCDPQGRHWSYHRTAAGSSGYQYSRVGASASTVRDGDVEGWAWGTGGAPPAATFADICGEVTIPTPTTSTPAPAPAPTAPAPPAPVAPPPTSAAPPGGGATRPMTPAAPAPPAPGATAPGATAPGPEAAREGDAPASAEPEPTTTSTTAPASPLEGDLAAAPGDDDGGGGGSVAGLAAFAVALAAVGGAAVVVRRRRSS